MTKRSEQQLPEQILLTIQYADRILAEDEEVATVLIQHNVTEAAYYRWRNHYRGLNAERRQEPETTGEAEYAVEDTAR